MLNCYRLQIYMYMYHDILYSYHNFVCNGTKRSTLKYHGKEMASSEMKVINLRQ